MTSKLALTTFTNELGASVSNVLSQALGSEWRVETGVPGQSQISEPLTLVVTVTNGIEGHFSIDIERGDAAYLAGSFMALPEPEPQWSAETQEAVEELFRQIVGEVSTRLKPRFGETTMRLSSEGSGAKMTKAVLLMASSGSTSIPMAVQINDEMMKSLCQRSTSSEGTDVDAREVRVAERNLDLLMDVELGATLRFGCKVMPLRQILELASGSVIELDRQVQEPVDLLLEGKLVARGEVVIVDGNYGLRISEVVRRGHQYAAQ